MEEQIGWMLYGLFTSIIMAIVGIASLIRLDKQEAEKGRNGDD